MLQDVHECSGLEMVYNMHLTILKKQRPPLLQHCTSPPLRAALHHPRPIMKLFLTAIIAIATLVSATPVPAVWDAPNLCERDNRDVQWWHSINPLKNKTYQVAMCGRRDDTRDYSISYDLAGFFQVRLGPDLGGIEGFNNAVPRICKKAIENKATKLSQSQCEKAYHDKNHP